MNELDTLPANTTPIMRGATEVPPIQGPDQYVQKRRGIDMSRDLVAEFPALESTGILEKILTKLQRRPGYQNLTAKDITVYSVVVANVAINRGEPFRTRTEITAAVRVPDITTGVEGSTINDSVDLSDELTDDQLHLMVEASRF